MEVSGQLHTPASLFPCNYWIGGWMGPRVGLDAVWKRKKSVPQPEIKPQFYSL